MQFFVRGFDGADSPPRRALAREAHLALGATMKANGNLLHAAAVLNDAGQMVGSVMIVDFTDREQLDGWLEIEPYLVNSVWERVEVTRCQVGPAFIPAQAQNTMR